MKSKQKKTEMKEDSARIAKLKKQRKEMAKELDELSGKTTKGKAMSVLLCLLIFGIILGGLVGMVKMNVNGIADNVLGPVIGDVPVARSILPKRLQRKSAGEIAAKKKADKAAKATAAAAKKAEDQAKAQAKATAEAAKKAQAKADAEAKKQARAQAKATAAAKKEAAITDYADTYANMDPAQAASIFTEMMAGDSKLVARILQHMPSNKRAAIIANMDSVTAAQITKVMEK